jgi:putative transposase
MYPEGVPVARCTVERLTRADGLAGVVRGKTRRTTTPAALAARPGDLLERDFTAPAPDRRWGADITGVATWSGFIHLVFVADLFSRRIVGWRASTSPRADLALDALEQAIWQRGREGADLVGLINHSDRGVQYLTIRSTERLAEIGTISPRALRAPGKPSRPLGLASSGDAVALGLCTSDIWPVSQSGPQGHWRL